MDLPSYVYVASSWRNPVHDKVCTALRVAGVDHYDFKNPPNGAGFGWEQTRIDAWEFCSTETAREGKCAAHAEHKQDQDMGWIKWMGKIPSHKDLPVGGRKTETPESFLKMLNHPIAEAGFYSDFDNLYKASHVVCVLPCGKSAHLELGYAIGMMKRTAILLEDPCEPELMYKMVDYLAPTQKDLMDWLGVP